MNENVSIVRSMDDAEKAAKAMSASGFFPDSKQAAQAIVKILAGQELGFGPFASMTGVSIIQGKPSIGANLMAAAVKRTGKYNYRIVELTNQVCELSFLENNQEVGRSRFTLDDAKQAGLLSKDNWGKYPRNMLFARALSNGQRWYAPDVFNGALVYTPDELGASTDEDGNIINVTAREVAPDPTPEPKQAMTLEFAENELTKDGTRYGDLPTDKLSYMVNTINETIAKNHLTNEKKTEYQRKLDAITTILAHRNQ